MYLVPLSTVLPLHTATPLYLTSYSMRSVVLNKGHSSSQKVMSGNILSCHSWREDGGTDLLARHQGCYETSYSAQDGHSQQSTVHSKHQWCRG